LFDKSNSLKFRGTQSLRVPDQSGIVRLPKTIDSFLKAELLKKNKIRVFETSGNSAFSFIQSLKRRRCKWKTEKNGF